MQTQFGKWHACGKWDLIIQHNKTDHEFVCARNTYRTRRGSIPSTFTSLLLLPTSATAYWQAEKSSNRPFSWEGSVQAAKQIGIIYCTKFTKLIASCRLFNFEMFTYIGVGNLRPSTGCWTLAPISSDLWQSWLRLMGVVSPAASSKSQVSHP